MSEPNTQTRSSSRPTYSIATLVTDWDQHTAMRQSFEAAGFTIDDCQYHFVDNTGQQQTSAYSGLNQLLNDADGRFIILCHQDVRLEFDDRAKLDSCLEELEQRDPNWALAGNAGATKPGNLTIRITDPHGDDQRRGHFPARVMSLDENFIVIKRQARLSFSRNLDGFHLYGADICLVADVLGYTAYVIDFHLHHLSPGRKSADFFQSRAAFSKKWSHALRPRILQTTCTLIRLSPQRFSRRISDAATAIAEKVLRRYPRLGNLISDRKVI